MLIEALRREQRKSAVALPKGVSRPRLAWVFLLPEGADEGAETAALEKIAVALKLKSTSWKILRFREKMQPSILKSLAELHPQKIFQWGGESFFGTALEAGAIQTPGGPISYRWTSSSVSEALGNPTLKKKVWAQIQEFGPHSLHGGS